MIICNRCKKDFEYRIDQRGRRPRFCSYHCRYMYHYERRPVVKLPPPKYCRQCNKQLDDEYRGRARIYCSRLCRNRYYYSNRLKTTEVKRP